MKKIKTVFGIFLMMLLVLWLTPAGNITAKAASYTSLQVGDHLTVYDQISYDSTSLKFGNIEGLTELSSGTLTLKTGYYNSGTNSYTVALSTDGNYYVFVDQANTVYGLSDRGAFRKDLSEGLVVQSVENGVITFAPYLPSHTLTYKYDDSGNPQYSDYVVNDANKRSKALTSMPAGWTAPEGKVLDGWLFHNADWGETVLGAPISITKDDIYATPLWVESYGLWVGDTAVTKNKKSDYGWSYAPDSNTLTLNNFFYSGVGHYDNAANPHYGGIYYDGEDPLKIQISGNNSIENTHTANLPCGIYSTKDVTINGTGTLEIVASSYTISQGIWCDKAAFEQTDGNIVVKATNNGIYTKKGAKIIGGSLDLSGSYGITGDEKNYKLVIGSDVESVVISGSDMATDFPVINALKGTGWTDKDGTQGKADIEISTQGQTLNYKRVQFMKVKTPATIAKKPTAKTLTYNGQAQELVEEGKTDGGTMQYTLGKDATTVPTADWSTSIPTATDAGTYYVWYKAVGDADHSDSEAACVTVTIGESTKLSYKVTFKVVNGAWNDGTTADKTITLTGVMGDSLKLSADQIPAVGDKPGNNYKAGSWNTTPDTTTEVTADKTFTYTYAVDDTDSGEITNKVIQQEDTPEAKVEGLDSELAESVMTEEEKAKVNAGDDVSLTLEMTNIDSSVAQEEKNLTDNALKNENKNSKVGMFFDISLWLKVGQGEARQVTETGKKVIKVTIQVPDKFKAPAGVKRNFYVIHIHNKVAKVLAKTTSMSIPLSLDGFSTFALAYADEAETEAVNDIFFSGVKITQKDGKIKVAWDKTSGVAKYEVYATYCGTKYPKKATATTKKNTITLKKINNKKINFKKNFKLYVVAYDSDGNQVGKTVSAHFAGKDNKKFKNIKTLKLSTKSITVAVGKTSKIKASTTLEKGKKKELSDSHAAKFRYKSTNKSIATVDKNGKVTGVSAGKCAVYVYSRNGLAKKVSVTVK